MKLSYSKHAAENVRVRKIRQEDVEAAIAEPDDKVSTDTGCDAYVKNLGDQFITVIVDPSTDPLHVVTAWYEAP